MPRDPRYSRDHQRTRDAWLRLVTTASPCCRCQHPLGDGKIALDHNDNGIGYKGFAHDTPCPVCGKRCNSRAGGQHAALNQGKRLRERDCDVCGKPYKATYPAQKTCGQRACIEQAKAATRARRTLPPPPDGNARAWLSLSISVCHVYHYQRGWSLVNLGGFDLIIALAAFLVVAAGVIGLNFRINRNTANVTNYRDAAQSWESKARAQETEIADLQTKVADLQNQLTAEREARHVLEGVVSGKSAVENLEMKVEAEFANIKAAFADWTGEARKEHLAQKELLTSWTGEVRDFLHSLDPWMDSVSSKLDRLDGQA